MTPSASSLNRVSVCTGAPSSLELQQIEAWLHGAPGLARTYPQIFTALGRGTRWCIDDDGDAVSHAASIDVSIRGPRGPVAARLVGSVATDPRARGRGFATALLRHLVECAARDERDAVLLWSDRWDFYARLGFAPSGIQHEIVIRSRHDTASSGVRPAQIGDLPAMWALHQRKPLRVERTQHDMVVLLSAAPMTTMVLERDDQVVAYACHGKGLDFAGWWHEVGGSDADVVALLRGALTALDQRQATLLLPAYRDGVRAAFAGSIDAARVGAAALCRALTARGTGDLFVDGLDSV